MAVMNNPAILSDLTRGCDSWAGDLLARAREDLSRAPPYTPGGRPYPHSLTHVCGYPHPSRPIEPLPPALP